MRWFITFTLFALCSVSRAQQSNFVGGFVGVSTLSADGVSDVGPDTTRISLYKPENGWAGMAVVGRHLSDYWSVQAVYGWNRSSLSLTSSLAGPEGVVFYEQPRHATTQRVLAELMLYARKRSSRARPYLSVGGGGAGLSSPADSIGRVTDGGLPAPAGFRSLRPALQVAVGVDIEIANGWDFRFAFSETISGNGISEQLTPPAGRNLANFQNLFGFIKRF